ncbi:MAG: flagellar hook-associated protein FlgK [Lachnospiraceae bacterium]|nr:flagellar hook-associated protein FlgK [Lachnospira sp.]MBR6697142.1 flagellar hook-associated protein FlgK [Lachnospiraceae bacterium]
MASTFFGLTIAYSGLQTYQIATNTTAHNISNIRTEGYTRQVTTLNAAESLRSYADYGTVGTGVEAVSVSQIRDAYLDDKYRDNLSNYGEYLSKYNYMVQIEDYYNEINAEGFTAEYNNFYNALEELEKDPNNVTIKNQVINCAQSLCDYFNNISVSLTNIQTDVNEEIKNKVDRINTIATNLASLNKQINNIEVRGGEASDLRDKRSTLLDELSQIVNIDISETRGQNGTTHMNIRINGQDLVDGYNFNQLVTTPKETRRNASDATDLYEISWEGGMDFDEYSHSLKGELKGLLDIRDGCNLSIETKSGVTETVAGYNTSYKGIPHYQAQMNKFIATFVDTINNVFTKPNATNSDGEPGVEMFVAKYAGDISALNVAVNEVLLTDHNRLATTYDASKGESDASLVSDLLDLKNEKIINNTTASDFLQSVMSEIGIDVYRAKTFDTTYSTMKASIQNQRLSVMGVDEDEEGMDLMKFQSAYELCGKMLSVMTEMYNKLINEMGV